MQQIRSQKQLKPSSNIIPTFAQTTLNLTSLSINQTSNQNIPSFLLKTFQILQNTQFTNIISWTRNGQGFIVKNVKQFSTKILPVYFRHNNYTSFVRQLNMYDFHKTRQENQQNAFKNFLFKKGHKHLLKEIQRKDYKKNKQNNKQLYNMLQKPKNNQICSMANLASLQSVGSMKQIQQNSNIAQQHINQQQQQHIKINQQVNQQHSHMIYKQTLSQHQNSISTASPTNNIQSFLSSSYQQSHNPSSSFLTTPSKPFYSSSSLYTFPCSSSLCNQQQIPVNQTFKQSLLQLKHIKQQIQQKSLELMCFKQNNFNNQMIIKSIDVLYGCGLINQKMYYKMEKLKLDYQLNQRKYYYQKYKEKQKEDNNNTDSNSNNSGNINSNNNNRMISSSLLKLPIKNQENIMHINPLNNTNPNTNKNIGQQQMKPELIVTTQSLQQQQSKFAKFVSFNTNIKSSLFIPLNTIQSKQSFVGFQKYQVPKVSLFSSFKNQ